MAVYTDGFEGAAVTTDLDAWTPDGTASGWSLVPGSITGGLQVYTSGNCGVTDGVAHCTLDDKPAGDNYYVEAVRHFSFGFNYIMLRHTDLGNFIGAHIADTDGRVDVYRFENFGFTALGNSGAVNCAAGETFRLEVENNEIRLRIGGVLAGGDPMATDTVFQGVRDWGLRGDTGSFDYWRSIEFGDIGAPPATPAKIAMLL